MWWQLILKNVAIFIVKELVKSAKNGIEQIDVDNLEEKFKK